MFGVFYYPIVWTVLVRRFNNRKGAGGDSQDKVKRLSTGQMIGAVAIGVWCTYVLGYVLAIFTTPIVDILLSIFVKHGGRTSTDLVWFCCHCLFICCIFPIALFGSHMDRTKVRAGAPADAARPRENVFPVNFARISLRTFLVAVISGMGSAIGGKVGGIVSLVVSSLIVSMIPWLAGHAHSDHHESIET